VTEHSTGSPPVTEPSAGTQPDAGWYPDPAGTGALRWWDGSAWTESTHDHPDSGVSVPPGTQPVVTPPAAPASSAPVSADGTRAPRRATWSVVIAVLMIAVAIAAVVALISPFTGRTELDTRAVEQQIGAELTTRVGQQVTVSCPSSVPISAGSTFTCTATAADGSTSSITVRQKDDQGDVEWSLGG
jgi:hypothetical protein